jgi:peptide/nickel transport system permease protein
MGSAFPLPGLAGFTDLLHHLALPALTLAIVLGAVIARHQRAAMLAVRDREYIRAARAKGVGEGRLFVAHALRNALAPVLAVAGVILPSLISGAALVETIFAWPGMGATVVEAVSSRDYHLVVGCVLVSSVAVVLGTLLADFALAWADPRQRGRR